MRVSCKCQAIGFSHGFKVVRKGLRNHPQYGIGSAHWNRIFCGWDGVLSVSSGYFCHSPLAISGLPQEEKQGLSLYPKPWDLRKSPNSGDSNPRCSKSSVEKSLLGAPEKSEGCPHSTLQVPRTMGSFIGTSTGSRSWTQTGTGGCSHKCFR